MKKTSFIVALILFSLTLASCSKLPAEEPAVGIGRNWHAVLADIEADGTMNFTFEWGPDSNYYRTPIDTAQERAEKAGTVLNGAETMFKNLQEDSYGIWYAELEAPDGGEPLVCWRVEGPGLDEPVLEPPTLWEMQTLMYQPEVDPEPEPAATYQCVSAFPCSDDDRYWFYQIVEAEVEGQSYEDKMIIAEVILNRVNSPLYPDTITEVIYQYDNGWQFTPVIDGRLYSVGPTDETKQAVDAVLSGERVLWDDHIVGFCTWAAQTPWFWEHCEYVSGYEHLAHMLWRMNW
ncbi:MAG: cell wall hydrolase [Clostridia bacterium]|nr:cell wall hydrolase [Clostridia bacterium]